MSRAKYLAKRFGMAIPVIWLGTSATWFLIYVARVVNPAAYTISQSEAQNSDAVLQARESLGLNDPPLEAYVDFMTSLYTMDWGQTLVFYQGSEVQSLIWQFAPRTVWLGLWSVLIAIFIGVPLGFYAGMRSNTFSDYFASVGGIVWRAMPNFWLAVMLLAVLIQSDFLIGFDWDGFIIPIDGPQGPPTLEFMSNPVAAVTSPVEWWIDPNNGGSFLQATKKIMPPALVLGSASMGNEMRIGRTAVMETKNKNFIDFAKARGVSNRLLVWKHIFRNALVPLVPIITSEAFLLIGGSVLVETVFNIQGMGWLFFRAVIRGDLPLVGALMFVFILLIVGINIVQDLLYTLIDPRVGYEE
jgi:peptide/nickel transport system permease protein